MLTYHPQMLLSLHAQAALKGRIYSRSDAVHISRIPAAESVPSACLCKKSFHWGPFSHP